jgi:acyl carrier protein
VQLQNELTEPSSGLERQLTVIWKTVLGVDRIGTKDDFFELGGHSLLALRMMVEIKNTLGVNLPLATLLEAPTIERLAELLQSQGIVAPSQPPPNARVGASSRPSLADRIARAARTSVRWSFSRWHGAPFGLVKREDVRSSFRPRSGEADGTSAEGGVVKRGDVRSSFRPRSGEADGTSAEGGVVKREDVRSSFRPRSGEAGDVPSRDSKPR